MRLLQLNQHTFGMSCYRILTPEEFKKSCFYYGRLKGMKDTIHQIYPKAKYQHCCIHVSRNIAHKVRVKDRKEICDDFKAVYQANSKKKRIPSYPA